MIDERVQWAKPGARANSWDVTLKSYGLIRWDRVDGPSYYLGTVSTGDFTGWWGQNNLRSKPPLQDMLRTLPPSWAVKVSYADGGMLDVKVEVRE